MRRHFKLITISQRLNAMVNCTLLGTMFMSMRFLCTINIKYCIIIGHIYI